MDDIMYLLREKCHRKTAFCYIIMTIPVTLNLVNSESICLVRPKIPRRDETTSKNLGRLFGRCRVTDGRLPTLEPIIRHFLVSEVMIDFTVVYPKSSHRYSHLLKSFCTQIGQLRVSIGCDSDCGLP